ncbi:membrane protein [Candidatus Thiomargarita nelsonii]|uniref:Membrane protein n=1 Tax=Candidatus Thiomargarita nelsonii TaxID=1003181 RepID=A0A0A6RJN0_9GAMM|nr:membrane protein [Candidatus Thiomargarita nelsonii]
MNEVRFPYKQKIVVSLLGILFFCVCMLCLGHLALTNDRGMILNQIIEFSVEGATIFYWCLTVASGLFVIFGILGLMIGLTTKKEIIITENEISAPKSGISKKIVSVKYSEITEMNIQSIQKERFLQIFYQGGRLSIPQSMLPSKQAFEELVNLVSTRANS